MESVYFTSPDQDETGGKDAQGGDSTTPETSALSTLSHGIGQSQGKDIDHRTRAAYFGLRAAIWMQVPCLPAHQDADAAFTAGMWAARNAFLAEPSLRGSDCEACAVPLMDDDTCPSCMVWHGDPCAECGHRGYHARTCVALDTPENDEAAYL